MAKASKTKTRARAVKPTRGPTAAAVADELLSAKRDLQRAHRTQKDITALSRQLARRVTTADSALLDLGAKLMARAARIQQSRASREERQPQPGALTVTGDHEER